MTAEQSIGGEPGEQSDPQHTAGRKSARQIDAGALSSNQQLKTCPFCGGACNSGTVRYSDMMVKEQEWEQQTFHFVSCEVCGTKNVGLVGFSTPEKAAAHWNQRTVERRPAASKKLLESIEACLEEAQEKIADAQEVVRLRLSGQDGDAVETPDALVATLSAVLFEREKLVRLADELITATADDPLAPAQRSPFQITNDMVALLKNSPGKAPETNDRLSFLEARMGTICNIAEGPLTAKAQQEIARLAREALRPAEKTESSQSEGGHSEGLSAANAPAYAEKKAGPAEVLLSAGSAPARGQSHDVSGKRPELCHHDDPSWCTGECAEKLRKFREWFSSPRPGSQT